MIKFLVLATVLTVSLADPLEKLYGTWTTIVVHPKETVESSCASFTVSKADTKSTCKCGGNPVESFRYTQGNVNAVFPILTATTLTEAEEKLKLSCDCDDVGVVLSITDNYSLYLSKDDKTSDEYSIEMSAKVVPKEAELREFLTGIFDVKDDVTVKCL